MKKINDESGFSAVELILVIAVIALLGVVGWLVYRDNHKTTVTTATKNTTTATSNANKSKAKTATTPNILKIPELGIEISLPNSLKDLTYAVNNQTPVNGEANISVGLSTVSLANLDPQCATSQSPIGILSKTSGQYPVSPTIDNTSGVLVEQYSTYYIAFAGSQAACSASTSTQNIQTSDKSELILNSSTVTLL